MKVVIPFKVPHDVDPREDYFELCRDAGNGDFVSTQELDVFEIIQKINGENVHAHGRGLPFPEFSCLFSKRSVYTPHNNHFGASKATQFLRSIIFKRYTWIAAQTDYGRRNYIKQGADPKKIIVLPIPINYSFFSRPKGGKSFRRKFGLKNEPFVLCINARRTKNPEIIIEACKKAGIKLVFVSRKSKKEVQPGFEWMLPEKEILEKESDDVIFTGKITKKDLLAALDAATLYVNSSDDGGECFSLSVYEAAAAGVPLCLPNFGVFESFKGAALFHKNKDPDELSKNIINYLGDSKLRRDNVRKARKIAKKFDYPVVRRMYENFYKKIGFLK